MNDDDAALLAAIRAAPDDDAPRAVYADALLARGDMRGEYILVQLRLAELGAAGVLSETQSKEAERLIARQAELGEMVGRLAPNVQAFTHRGFAIKAILRPNGERELLTDPLFHTTLADIVVWQSTQERVVVVANALPASSVPLVHTLSFSGSVGDGAALADWDLLGQLRTLQFIGSEISLDALQRVLRAPRTTPLTKLAVFNGELAGIGKSIFSLCPALVELELKFAALDIDDVDALVATKQPALRSLDLSGNRFGNAGAGVLANAHALDELSVLGLASCDVTAAGYHALIAG